MNSLHNLGLTHKEATLYEYLLTSGGYELPSALSQKLGINRTTVYSIAYQLERDGLVALSQRGGRMHVCAFPAEKLRHIVDVEKVSLDQKKRVVDDFVRNYADLSSRPLYDTHYCVAENMHEVVAHLLNVLSGESQWLNMSVTSCSHSDEGRLFLQNCEDFAISHMSFDRMQILYCSQSEIGGIDMLGDGPDRRFSRNNLCANNVLLNDGLILLENHEKFVSLTLTHNRSHVAMWKDVWSAEWQTAHGEM